MRVSTNIIQQLVDFNLPETDELVRRINLRLGGVEQVIHLDEKYKDVRIVRVVDCYDHENSDHLHVCLVDDGGVVEQVERDDNGYVQVVCGAPNLHRDMWAVWLPPRSTVPATFEDSEPFVLAARPLRGVLSQGMLAAADELAIGTDHEGIVEVTEKDLRESGDLQPGMSFAQAFGLDDVIIDIENKMFTHRPDLFGQLGVAREISAILQPEASATTVVDNHFKNPDWYLQYPEFANGEGLDLAVSNDIPELVPRFSAVAIKNVTVDKSPLWLQCQLMALGVKPINTVIDATNYIMLMTAQPTHAYDYDKLHGHKIGVRMAKQGEQTTLLNGKTYELTAHDIVIVDGEEVVGLGGVMGGRNSEVSNETKNIVLEVANFNMYAIRKTSMRHGLFTDAVTRFTKGQSPLQTTRVLKRLIDISSGIQASTVFDLFPAEQQATQDSVYGEISISADFVNQRLGTTFTNIKIGNILRAANFTSRPSEYDDTQLVITAPYWRTDIELPEDIVEEVGRLYGFERIDRQLPRRTIKPAPKNQHFELKRIVRESLSRMGANEVLTYSFVHEHILSAAHQSPEQAYRLSNALSPDLQYYRLNVLPSLLDKVHANSKAGYATFTLFEIGKGHTKHDQMNDEDLPVEHTFIDAVYTDKERKDGAAYYHLQRQLTQLSKDLGVDVRYVPLEHVQVESYSSAPFEMLRSAAVQTTTGQILGVIGELKRSVIKQFKLPEYTAAWTLDFDALYTQWLSSNVQYHALSKYPTISQDISLRTDLSVSFLTLSDAVRTVLDKHTELYIMAQPVAIYQPDDKKSKTTTFHIEYTSYDRTLTDADIAPIMEEIAAYTLQVASAQRV